MEQVLSSDRGPEAVRDAPDPEHPPRLDPRHDLLERAMGIVGRTSAIRALRAQVDRFAHSTANVLVTGETGTGKELVARALHERSRRARGPFASANVAALSSSMLASELFGHERGAFTGAYTRHRGLFEQAHGGTLFLDEIGELLPDAQVSLLRVLETREVRPVGAERTRPVDVRLVAATHRNLATLVSRGLFREDLYYRLHLLVVSVPALRFRIADVPRLAEHFLATLGDEHGLRMLDADAREVLMTYAWPGNVRQLANVLRRIAVTHDSTRITREQVLDALTIEGRALHECREAASTATVLGVLAAESGNITRTARRLGIARSTVRAHMLRAGVTAPG